MDDWECVGQQVANSSGTLQDVGVDAGVDKEEEEEGEVSRPDGCRSCREADVSPVDRLQQNTSRPLSSM